jgi:hypothetical protein
LELTLRRTFQIHVAERSEKFEEPLWPFRGGRLELSHGRTVSIMISTSTSVSGIPVDTSREGSVFGSPRLGRKGQHFFITFRLAFEGAPPKFRMHSLGDTWAILLQLVMK